MTSHGSPAVWSKIKRLLGQDEEAPGAAGHGEAPPPKSSQQRPVASNARTDDHDFDQSLAKLMQIKPLREFVMGGKISLLETNTIRDRLGKLWPKWEERVHAIVQDILRSHLGNRDLFTRYVNDSYLIVFSDADAAEAKLKSLLIANEITNKLFGESELGQENTVLIQTVVAKVDGQVARQSIDVATTVNAALCAAEQAGMASNLQGHDGQYSLMPEEILEILGKAERSVEALESLDETADGMADGMIVYRDSAQKALRQLRDLEDVMSASDKSWTAMTATVRPAVPKLVSWKGNPVEPVKVAQAIMSRGNKELMRRKMPVVWVCNDRDPDTKNVEPKYSYLPIWNLRQEKIALYLCHAAMDIGDTTFSCGAIAACQPDLAVIDTIDRLTLRHAKRALQDTMAKNLVNMIGLPVHFSSLNRLSASEEYFRICHAMPAEERRMLVWEIVHAPPGAWKLQLGPALVTLKTLGRASFLRIETTETSFPMALRNLEYLPELGIRVVGLDLGAVTLSEAGASECLTALAERCAPLGLLNYAFGLSSPLLVQTAAQLHFDYLAGSAIAELVEEPQGVIPRSFADL